MSETVSVHNFSDTGSKPVTIKRGELVAYLRSLEAEDQPFDQWWDEFAEATARRSRFALACNNDGEPWPSWSSRETVAVALVLDDTDVMRTEGCNNRESAMRFVANGNFDPPADMGTYIERIRASIR